MAATKARTARESLLQRVLSPHLNRTEVARTVRRLDSWRDKAVIPQENDASRAALFGGAE